MRVFVLCLALMITACSGADNEQNGPVKEQLIGSFEPFPQPSEEEISCSVWRQGEDGKTIFRSQGGFEGHIATTYYGEKILTLRSSQSSGFGNGNAILYAIDGYADRQVSLKTDMAEFGNFAGTITMQHQVDGKFEALGEALSVEGLCAG